MQKIDSSRVSISRKSRGGRKDIGLEGNDILNNSSVPTTIFDSRKSFFGRVSANIQIIRRRRFPRNSRYRIPATKNIVNIRVTERIVVQHLCVAVGEMTLQATHSHCWCHNKNVVPFVLVLARKR